MVGGTDHQVRDGSRRHADEITQLYPDLSLSDVHRALAYYYDHVDEFRSASATEA